MLKALTGMGYRLFLLHDPWSNFHEVNVLNIIQKKKYTKRYRMSHDVGHVLEIKKNLEDKLVHELFSQKNDFNIWLSNRDLTNELTLLSSFPLFDVVVAP